MVGEPEGGTGAWFATRTDEQLKEIVRANWATNPGCHAAQAELDRRRAERSESRQLFWIKVTLAATVALGIGGIAATLLKS